MIELIILGALTVFTLMIIFMGIRTVRPTERALIERMGKYHKYAKPGLNIVIPFIDSLVYVNITEMMAEIEKQEIITSDKLNAQVAAQIYFKVKDDEPSVKSSQYNVHDVHQQIEALISTSLRNIIGTMSLNDANSGRNEINTKLKDILAIETGSWGIEIVRAELMEIDPPQDVQETMNQVVVAANKKLAAIDFATAQETQADGARRAAIKQAEGEKQAAILAAEGLAEATVTEAKGKAEAIIAVNKAAQDSMVGPALELRKIEALEKAFGNNTKIIVPSGGSLVNIIDGLIK